MKNLYLIDEYTSSLKNGIGVFLNELIYCLDLSDYRINLVSFNADTDEFNITEDSGFRQFLFPSFKRGFLNENSKIIDKFLRLHIPDSSDNVFFLNHSPCSNLMKSIKDSHPESKIIFTIHDFGWTHFLLGNIESYKSIIKDNNIEQTEEEYLLTVFQQELEMYQLADMVVCLSEDTYSILKSFYQIDAEKLSLIPNGLRSHKLFVRHEIPNEQLRREKGICKNDKILLFTGRPTKQKGVFDLIEALKIILKKHRNIKLIIVGEGNEVSMKELINVASEIASSVVYTGQINRQEVMDWLSIADIGIISSYYEQCSYSAIEMMMHALPIVASDGLGIRNMFVDGLNAQIAKIGDRSKPEEYQNNLANAIIKLLTSPKSCERLSLNARETYENRFHIRYMKDGYKELINRL